MKNITLNTLYIRSTFALIVLFTCCETMFGATAVIKTVTGNCQATKESGQQFKKIIYIDGDGDGKADCVRTVWCDGSTSMGKPVIVAGTGDLGPDFNLRPVDFKNITQGDIRVWAVGFVLNNSGDTLGTFLKDSTNLQISITFYQVGMLNEDLQNRNAIHPEQYYVAVDKHQLIVRPVGQPGMHSLHIESNDPTHISKTITYYVPENFSLNNSIVIDLSNQIPTNSKITVSGGDYKGFTVMTGEYQISDTR
jgi:hypothetical protein